MPPPDPQREGRVQRVAVREVQRVVELAHEGDWQRFYDAQAEGANDRFAVGARRAGVPAAPGADGPGGLQGAAREKRRKICEFRITLPDRVVWRDFGTAQDTHGCSFLCLLVSQDPNYVRGQG